MRVTRSTLYELRHTPSAWWLGALAVTYPLVVIGLLLGLLDAVWDSDGIRSLLASASAVGALMVLFGVVHAAGDYRHRTVLPLMLAHPGRTPAAAGRLAAYAAVGAGVGLAATILSIALTYGWLAASGVPFDIGAGALAAVLLGATGYSALGAVLGGGLGALARNQVTAAIAVFVYLAMLDPPLAQVIPAYGRFGPTALGIAMSGGPPAEGGPGQRLLPWPVATAVWAGGALLLAIAGITATRRRELP
jgi:ABC-2 type transport system permease protein